MPSQDRGITWDFVWDGRVVEPYGKDDNFEFFKCAWDPSASTGRGRDAQYPTMGFRVEINNPRWQVDRYDVDLLALEGHPSEIDLSKFHWITTKTIDAATHTVDVDKPWHLSFNISAETQSFLPPRSNNPTGCYLIWVRIRRNGTEIERGHRGKAKVDSTLNPLAGYFLKLNVMDITQQRASGSGRYRNSHVIGL
ncbi:hypothetical protein ABW20_dc0107530 [Dactylellina cionopaga]|nr:hypothetical protein ABW20_dc0107530 [Dactylellina cionopaga]